LVVTVALVATALGLHVEDGKPWVLGVIVVLILIFISKMMFLSRIEKVTITIRARTRSFLAHTTWCGELHPPPTPLV
jgi:hypothetical protein